MSNQDPPPHPGAGWPPPQIARSLRIVATALSAGASAAGFSGHATLAGALAAAATVVLLIDITTSGRRA
jgi:hypothetical protein